MLNQPLLESLSLWCHIESAHTQESSSDLLGIVRVAKVVECGLEVNHTLMGGPCPPVEVHEDAVCLLALGDFKMSTVLGVDLVKILLHLHFFLIRRDFLYFDVRDIADQRNGLGLQQIPRLHQTDEVEFDGNVCLGSNELNLVIQL